MAIRLVLVDDHPIVLQGLQQLFERHDDFQVMCCCQDGATALDAVEQYQPDVLVMDLRMPGLSGLDVLRALTANQSRTRTVLLTAIVRDSEVMEAIKSGVRGIVLKESSPDVLIDCVRRVHRGEQWIERETVTLRLHALVDVRRDPLTIAKTKDGSARARPVARVGLERGVVDRTEDDVLDVAGGDQARAL